MGSSVTVDDVVSSRIGLCLLEGRLPAIEIASESCYDSTTSSQLVFDTRSGMCQNLSILSSDRVHGTARAMTGFDRRLLNAFPADYLTVVSQPPARSTFYSHLRVGKVPY